MADEKPIPSVAVLVLLAVVGGSGTNLATRIIAPPRSDPWTGTQAREAHARLSREIDQCNDRLSTGKSREHERITYINKRLSDVESRLNKSRK